MKKSTLLIFCIMSILISRCKKGDETYKRTSEITMGNYDDMIVYHYDTILTSEYYSTKEFIIDLDNDNIDDIQFNFTIAGSQMSGTMHPRVTIQVISENVQLLVYQSKDTLYMNVDTLLYPANITYLFTYTCNQISANDSINKIEDSDKIIWLEYNDILRENDNTFKTSKFEFWGSYTTPPWKTETNGDTTIFYRNYYESCDTYSFAENTYIGVKFINTNRLGWIAIKGDLYSTTIIESAIQR